ncbi:MAG: apolipoprotein N-acyltransferase [Pyrinomonadaceae bacterium]
MSFGAKIKKKSPDLVSLLLAVISSVLMIFAFPDFEFWFLAWFAFVPLFSAVDRQKDSLFGSFLVGWLTGTIFFVGTCWWLTFAPITYAGFPAVLAYSLLFCVAGFAGLYFGLFAGLLSLVIKHFRFPGVLFAPFLWTAIEFLRYWTTGNNWNAIGYSQAFNSFVNFASFGGVSLVGFGVLLANTLVYFYLSFTGGEKAYSPSAFHPQRIADKCLKVISAKRAITDFRHRMIRRGILIIPVLLFLGLIYGSIVFFDARLLRDPFSQTPTNNFVVAVQPNVPMSGLTSTKWTLLRGRQISLAEAAINSPDFAYSAGRRAKADALPENFEKRKRFYEELAVEAFRKGNKIVVLPESPMNFQYELDPEFRSFIKEFAVRNNAAVLFNSAEPDRRVPNGYFNSAVMVNSNGEKIVQYDKMYLLPFGEFVPLPGFLAQYVPTMVGRFSPGEEYDLLPFGDAKAGIMICFESHFPTLSREFVRNGADVLVEMTNDGYLGNTPVLRQHLASAVFRAVETNRPVLRVTNVGITAYINESGEVLDAADSYVEATRIWSVSKSDGGKTIYVRFGDWFALLCLLVSGGVLIFIGVKRRK